MLTLEVILRMKGGKENTQKKKMKRQENSLDVILCLYLMMRTAMPSGTK